MSNLGLERSSDIVYEAFKKGRELNSQPLTVAILDNGGKLISLQRQDGASMMRPEIATAKAWGAVAMGKSSRSLGDDAQNRPSFISALNTLAQGNLIPVAGGVLVRNERGDVLGAVGISGDTSDIDEECAIHAIRAVGFYTDEVVA